MKNTPAPPADEEAGLARSWVRFWFSPADPFGLHLTRMLTGVVLLVWLLALAGQVPALFGLGGWFDRQAYIEAGRMQAAQMAAQDPSQQPGLPKPITWSLLYLAGSSTTRLLAIYWVSVVVLVLFTAGVATRLTAVLAWLVVASFTASPALDAELDPFLQLLTFYLALGYLLFGLREWKALSWLERVVGPRDSLLLGRLFRPREGASGGDVGANLAMRLLQVHFAILVVTTGLHKLQIGEWWSGTAHWFNVYPAMTTSVGRAREHITDPLMFLGLLNLAGYATLAWQITFPLFAWRSGWWRAILVGGAAAGWAGLWYLYRMPLLGPVFAIGCLVYLTSADWSAVGQALQNVSPLKRIGSWLAQPPESAWAPPAPVREPVGSLHAIRER